MSNRRKKRALEIIAFRVASLTLHEVSDLPRDYQIAYQHDFTFGVSSDLKRIKVELVVLASIDDTDVKLARIKTISEFVVRWPKLRREGNIVAVRRFTLLNALDLAASTTRGALVVQSGDKLTAKKPMPPLNISDFREQLPDPVKFDFALEGQ